MIDSSEKTEVWNRNLGESLKAHQAFVKYRDQGESRSYTEVARELGKSRVLIGRWGSKWSWQSRIFAWERHCHDELQRQNLKSILEMNDRHISIAQSFQQKVVDKLLTVDVETLAVADLPKWLAMAVTVERTARGLSPGTKLAAVVQPEYTRPEGNVVSDAVRSLSFIDRELLRSLALKQMQIYALEAEIASEQQSPSIDVKTEPTGNAPSATKSPGAVHGVFTPIRDNPIKAFAPVRG